MKFNTVANIFVATVMLVSCGQVAPTNDPLNKVESAKPPTETFMFRGSVTSAFSVTVDGERFADMEAFYTAEVDRLPAKVKAKGYDGYDVSFEAELGFNDLTNSMTVYVASSAKRGYQGKTQVETDDTFAVQMPLDAAGDFQVRANKRISVLLRKGDEKKRICYNFSASEVSVPYSEKDLPVQLSSFNSELTGYQCPQDEPGDGLSIPSAPAMPASDSGSSAQPAAAGIGPHASVGPAASIKLPSDQAVHVVTGEATHLIVLQQLTMLDYSPDGDPTATKITDPTYAESDGAPSTVAMARNKDVMVLTGSTSWFNSGERMMEYPTDGSAAKADQLPYQSIMRDELVSMRADGDGFEIVVANQRGVRLTNGKPGEMVRATQYVTPLDAMAMVTTDVAIYVMDKKGVVLKFDHKLNLVKSYSIDITKLSGGARSGWLVERAGTLEAVHQESDVLVVQEVRLID